MARFIWWFVQAKSPAKVAFGEVVPFTVPILIQGFVYGSVEFSVACLAWACWPLHTLHRTRIKRHMGTNCMST